MCIEKYCMYVCMYVQYVCVHYYMHVDQDLIFMYVCSNLAYPEILEAYQSKLHPPKASRDKSNSKSGDGSGSSGSGSGFNSAVADVYETWYPPMRSTLSLLSKLYGVVEMAVFEDFARRAIGTVIYKYLSLHTYILSYIQTYIHTYIHSYRNRNLFIFIQF